jgi:hypothetical protein
MSILAIDGIQHCASFDELRMREAPNGRQVSPQLELVEGRTALIPALSARELRNADHSFFLTEIGSIS